MNARDRVRAALHNRPTDQVPIFHLGFSSSVASAILGREAYVGGGIQQWREATAYWRGADAHAEFVERSYQDAIAIALAAGHDIIRASYWRYDRRPTRQIDENTYLYEYGPAESWQVLKYDPASEQCNIVDYKPRPPVLLDSIESQVIAAEEAAHSYCPAEEQWAFELRAQQEYGEQYELRVAGPHIGIPSGDQQLWFQALVTQPELVARYLDAQVERSRRTIEFLAGRGFVHFWNSFDIASDSGLMFSPAVFRQLFVPRLRAVRDLCHQAGALWLFSSDGNLWPVADALFGDGVVDGYGEVDGGAGMDLLALKQRYPELVLLGNISSRTVAAGSREQVVEEARRALEVAKSQTGVIVGTSNYLVPESPLENVMALLETLEEGKR